MATLHPVSNIRFTSGMPSARAPFARGQTTMLDLFLDTSCRSFLEACVM